MKKMAMTCLMLLILQDATDKAEQG